MSLYSKIKDLAAMKHVSIAQVERDLNLSNGSMAKWDKHSPKSENIDAVANYFNVTTDFLLDRKEAEPNPLEYYRIDTDDLEPDEIENMKNQLDQYTKFLVSQLKSKRKN